MNESLLLTVLIALTMIAYGLSLIYVIGIVWRVEAELDRAYKFFSLAVALLILSQILEALPHWETTTFGVVFLRTTDLLAALALLLGMFFMRDLVRRMDGEKNTETKK